MQQRVVEVTCPQGNAIGKLRTGRMYATFVVVTVIVIIIIIIIIFSHIFAANLPPELVVNPAKQTSGSRL
jgi:amino acid transporter